jgi:hypothetical protein
MSINKDILTALKDIGVPVSFQHYSGEADTYITFFTYLDKPEQHADDGELITGHYVQIDVWSKRDYTSLVKTIHQRMLAAGFTKLNFYDLYEQDLNIYHKAMRFFKEVQ